MLVESVKLVELAHRNKNKVPVDVAPPRFPSPATIYSEDGCHRTATQSLREGKLDDALMSKVRLFVKMYNSSPVDPYSLPTARKELLGDQSRDVTSYPALLRFRLAILVSVERAGERIELSKKKQKKVKTAPSVPGLLPKKCTETSLTQLDRCEQRTFNLLGKPYLLSRLELFYKTDINNPVESGR
jgi:hypothetical protein